MSGQSYLCEDTAMVKPIGPAPQSTRVKTEVEQPPVQSGNEQAPRTNQPAPIYSAKAQNARKAALLGPGQLLAQIVDGLLQLHVDERAVGFLDADNT